MMAGKIGRRRVGFATPDWPLSKIQVDLNCAAIH